MPEPHFRQVVLAAREQLKNGLAAVQRRHEAGGAGRRICAALTDLVDGIVLRVYDAALADLGAEIGQGVALVAHGGYARRCMAPFSDVDLMLLVTPEAESRVPPLAERMNQDLCDAGFRLGFSLRTAEQTCAFALSDATVFTAFAESRCLAGDRALFSRLIDRLRRETRGRAAALIEAIEAARQEERTRFGETVYLLTPNLKKSVGGLRDIQMVEWLGFARYGETDLRTLERMKALTREDRRRLRKAREFLLRVRNEMHFHAGKAQDVLDREEQVRLADLYRYPDRAGLLPVELFMRDYFRHTSEVWYCAAHFLNSAKTHGGPRRLWKALVGRSISGDFRAGPGTIAATRRGLEKVQQDVGQVLHLMELANLYDCRIEHGTWEAIRRAMARRPPVELSAEVIARFLSLLSQPARLGDLLRRLHELRVLEQIIPGMSHARGLMQFNDYHKYTVDEHSLRAVEEVTKFSTDAGPLGDAYRSLSNKRTLHLALLVHDLGKGLPGDHSDVGARLADATATRLGLPHREAETLRFLVHKHLLLSQRAQFRDIHAPEVVVDVAVQAGSPEVLQMLYLLTCADLAAVGPGTLTHWKRELLTQLYVSARKHLTGDAPVGGDDDPYRLQRDKLRELAQPLGDADWWQRQIAALPPACLNAGAPEQIVEQLQRLHRLPRTEATAWGQYLPSRRAVEYTIGTYDDITPGIFHKLTGVLSSHNMQILSAEINTLEEDLVLDRFFVEDLEYADAPPADRLEAISRKLVAVLKTPAYAPPRFPQIWGSRPTGKSNIPHLPTRVQVDNSTSERFTLVDIFACDRRGLLYTITRKLFELGLSVHMAKIGTHLDQVVDVFYVTDCAGRKLPDAPRLDQIRQDVLAEIVRFEASGR